MGADNWDVCPRCKARAAKAREELTAHLEHSYGSIPREEYLALVVRRLNEPPLPVPELTLREDYELRMEDRGRFNVSYHCSCTECGFSFAYNYAEYVKLEK